MDTRVQFNARVAGEIRDQINEWSTQAECSTGELLAHLVIEEVSRRSTTSTGRALDYPAAHLHRSNGPGTSRAAAQGDRREHRVRLLEAFRGGATMTADEASSEVGLDMYAGRRRISDLLRLAMLERLPVTRLTKFNRPAHVHRITTKGRHMNDLIKNGHIAVLPNVDSDQALEVDR